MIYTKNYQYINKGKVNLPRHPRAPLRHPRAPLRHPRAGGDLNS